MPSSWPLADLPVWAYIALSVLTIVTAALVRLARIMWPQNSADRADVLKALIARDSSKVAKVGRRRT